MAPHHSYQQYYAQPMGPMMPPYPHYQQQWYPPPYQPQYPQPYHGPRGPYYQPPMPPHPQVQQHGPLVVSSQPHMPPTPRAYPQSQQPPMPPPRRPSLTSTASNIQVQTPPSRPVSQVSAVQEQKDEPAPATVIPPPTDRQTTPTAKSEVANEPFAPPIPWLSVPDEGLPTRASRGKRTVLRSRYQEPVDFPLPLTTTPAVQGNDSVSQTTTSTVTEGAVSARPAAPAETPTTIPSDTQSDHMSTQPTTPSSAVAPAVKSQQTPTQQKASRVAMPVVPVIPAMPSSPVAARKVHRDSTASVRSKADTESVVLSEEVAKPEPSAEASPPAPVAPPAPKSWADLIRKQSASNGTSSGSTLGAPVINGLSVPRSESLGEVLGEINIAEAPLKIAFLKPRGLVNTGNMCYMNSVLQVLVFCIPFYDFLDKVGEKAAHTFKSTTPLVDAMIMFTKEYNSIDTASSVEQLRLRLKPEDFENYGDSLRPDFVYETINKLPRFRDMRRGHQQDAQEFLGFLLEELHEECTLAMQRSGTSASSGRSTPVGSVSNVSENVDAQDGWLEVGHKQRSAVTRSSGAVNADSPVNNIFGGKLRSELKVSGNKLSVTLEPYQPLQLDIGSPQVSNIVDALKGLTKPESMQGDFQSMRGMKASATKQVFIETLPPVLILHLKRFEYNSVTKRAEKIWKKVGYPLELEIPKEVFQPATRNKMAAHGGLPRYRLIGVIYHHGKNANGGHYTVDIRRQDGREWIRIDDTLIRRIRSEDVAEGGSEEDPKVLAAALERHKKQAQSSANRYENIEADEDEEEDAGNVWSQVAAGHGRSKSTISAIVNGSATPAKDASGPQTPRYKESVKDNKVAYLLFYQRISA
ncbi:hypothetical protein LTR24_002389 [Lithohypha guttulata]|uniref:Ubiquitin carboxyl-terminal hydrolase n=1 Tax=Lithohypha guttulata TaxID=1690604 RepID=A0ABR0KHT0_9EURO|nr:hypothetical protein LTR24_002389 [Lithohypha guttulata]